VPADPSGNSPNLPVEIREQGAIPRITVTASRNGDHLLDLTITQHTPKLLGLGVPHLSKAAPVEDTLCAVATWLHRHERWRNATLTSWETPRRAPLNDALAHAGYAVHRRKLFVERNLAEVPPSPCTPPPPSLVSLQEAGREEFIAAMRHCSADDPFAEEGSDAAQEFDELVEYAGTAFDPNDWFIARDKEGRIGIILPQIYADRPSEGTLFLIGVAPERRGVGWGTILHAHGLALLAERGAQRYVGSTDLRNERMVRVFGRNLCNKRGEQVLFRNTR